MKFYKIMAVTLAILLGSAISAKAQEQDDKFETFNRYSFAFNDKLDEYILRPVAVGYRTVTTQFMRDRVTGILSNVKEPISAFNHIIQGEFTNTFKNIGRFAINSTLGLAGMFDVAKDAFGIAPNETSFDETLAKYCIKDGPYLVLPFFGPKTPRSLLGVTVVDDLTHPVYLASRNDRNYSAKIIYSYVAVAAISQREAAIELIDDIKSSSVDYYATVRSAYLQNRTKYNYCGASANAQPAYDFDFNMDDDDFEE